MEQRCLDSTGVFGISIFLPAGMTQMRTAGSPICEADI
jgi:hypothetical protein